MTIVWLCLTLLGGVLLGFQPGINARLASHVGHPLAASLVSFGSATLLIAVVAVVLRVPAPPLTAFREMPAWVWVGGALGAAFVTIALMATPRLGAATVVALVVCGQLVAALVIDHFGLLGLTTRPLDWVKLLGACCLVLGVLLIRWR